MRTLVAIFAFIALTTGTQAYCFPVPDSASTGYVANDLKRTICIQNELAQSTNDRALQSELDAVVGKLQRDLQQQKFLLQQQQAFALPTPLLP